MTLETSSVRLMYLASFKDKYISSLVYQLWQGGNNRRIKKSKNND